MSQLATEERRPANATRLLIVLAAASGSTMSGILMIGPLLLPLTTEFNVSVAVAGQTVAAGALTWAALAPVCGALSDRYGRKPLLFWGMIIFGVFSILSGSATDLPTLFVARMLTSVGGALVATNAQTTLADLFPAKERARALGWIVTGLSLAPLIGVPAMALVADIADWRWSFRILGFLILLNGLWIHWEVPATRVKRSESSSATFGDLMRSGSVLGLLVCNAFERLSWGAMGTYLAAFLMETYGFSVGQVAPLISLMAIGALLGTLVGGRLAGWANPVTVYLVAQSVAGLSALPLVLFAPAVWFSGLLAAFFSGGNSSSRPSYLWVISQVPPAVRGQMMGLNVMTNQLGMLLGAALGGLAIVLGGYTALGFLAAGSALIAALSCRLLVHPESLEKVGMPREDARTCSVS